MNISLKGLFSGVTVGAIALVVVQFLYAHLNEAALAPWLKIIIDAIVGGLGIAAPAIVTHHRVSSS